MVLLTCFFWNLSEILSSLKINVTFFAGSSYDEHWGNITGAVWRKACILLSKVKHESGFWILEFYAFRCLNHGLREKRKNHKLSCSFRFCQCSNCIVSHEKETIEKTWRLFRWSREDVSWILGLCRLRGVRRIRRCWIWARFCRRRLQKRIRWSVPVSRRRRMRAVEKIKMMASQKVSFYRNLNLAPGIVV